MKEPMVIILLLLTVSVTACSRFLQPASAMIPTATFAPPPALNPSDAAVQPTDLVEAASAWHGIPIMPGATAGDGDEEAYVFTIEASVKQIREYYDVELAKLGWQSAAQQGGDSSVILMFSNSEAAILTVSIIEKDNMALVLLEK